jgi:hypothetical protein
VRVLGRYGSTQPLKIGMPVRLRFENDAHGTPNLMVDA